MSKLLIPMLALLVSLSACSPSVKVNVPPVNVNSRPRVDSSRVPHTTTHTECRDRLTEAYEQIRYLEAGLASRERKIKNLEDDKDELKRKVKRLEKRLDRYED